MQTNRGFIQILGPILIIIALGVGGYIYYQQNYNKSVPAPITEGEVGSGSSNEGSLGTKPQPVACTMEAKICPDGSAVGRTGPKCEFAACPNPAK